MSARVLNHYILSTQYATRTQSLDPERNGSAAGGGGGGDLDKVLRHVCCVMCVVSGVLCQVCCVDECAPATCEGVCALCLLALGVFLRLGVHVCYSQRSLSVLCLCLPLAVVREKRAGPLPSLPLVKLYYWSKVFAVL